ncbi:cell division protein ZipA C-terminal FtsZ-binding domain-containing protein [Pedobacter psychrodurus]|uniref:cell division protein ZipA C-terminal FtsZ-binding domain-containing protein n=1 Tax=Pedobacter psychrodurus TaxID=2530456 RepID=UPI00293167AE|nr:cell division protein ZipA C-terminal FtsZ-binding domain-containing protein [Pedobacter psychrodurus]
MKRITLFIALAIIFVSILTYFITNKKSARDSEKYFISTEKESNERVKVLHLDGVSEDASYILHTTKLSFPIKSDAVENKGYQADPKREWIINLIKVNGEDFNKNDIAKLFDYEWRTKYSSTIYGYSVKNHQWTYADTGDAPDHFNKIEIAIDLLDTYNTETPDYDPKKLERYIVEFQKRAKKFPDKLQFEKTEATPHAISKAKKIVQLHQEFNLDAIVILQAKQAFKGTSAWDALQSVGLSWGDGDLFHWINTHDYGGDEHFSVWTSTAPNYFLPEEVRAGNMNPKDLIFGFSLARSVDPENVFEIMVDAAKYCQKRLGGVLLNGDGQPLNLDNEKLKLKMFLSKMKQKGIIPGSNDALKNF